MLIVVALGYIAALAVGIALPPPEAARTSTASAIAYVFVLIYAPILVGSLWRYFRVADPVDRSGVVRLALNFGLFYLLSAVVAVSFFLHR